MSPHELPLEYSLAFVGLIVLAGIVLALIVLALTGGD